MSQDSLQVALDKRKLRYQETIGNFNSLLEDFIKFQRQGYKNVYDYYAASFGPEENWPHYVFYYPTQFGIADNPREPFSSDDLFKAEPRFVSVKLDIDMLDDFAASFKDSKYIDELIYIVTDPRHCIWLQETFDPERRDMPLESQDTFTKEQVENIRLRALQFLFLLSFKTFKEDDKFYQVDFFLNTIRELAESTNISPVAFSALMTRFEENMLEYIASIEFKESKNRKFVEDLEAKLELATILYKDLVFATAEEG